MHRPDLFLIQEAIKKNVCLSPEEELKSFSIDKQIRTSITHEGDSLVGLVLMVGIAKWFEYSDDEIMLFMYLEQEEFNKKLRRFKRFLKDDKRFLNKVRLVLNYLRLKS
jgi:hypothetical protein